MPEPFQAFRRTKGSLGDDIANKCWEETDDSGLVKSEQWRALYCVLKDVPDWKDTHNSNLRTLPQAFAAEMFHITALLHFTNSVHSLRKLGNQDMLKKCYKLSGQEAIIGTITSLYSSLDIHCHLMWCLRHGGNDLSEKLITSWNGQCPRKGQKKVKTIKLRDFFSSGKRSGDKGKLGPPELTATRLLKDVRELQDDLRNRVVHASFHYVVPKKSPEGSFMLKPSLDIDDIKMARGIAANAHDTCMTSSKKGPWDYVDNRYFYVRNGRLLSIQDLLQGLLNETIDFIKASADWVEGKWPQSSS